MPNTGQKGSSKKPNSFTIKEFGFYVEVGGGMCILTSLRYCITSF